MFHPPPAIIVAVGRRFPQGVLGRRAGRSACRHSRYAVQIDDFYVDPLLSKR
jgi:hypothetical protein